MTSVRPCSSHDTQTIENLLKKENNKRKLTFQLNLEAKRTKQKCWYIVANSRDTSVVEHIQQNDTCVNKELEIGLHKLDNIFNKAPKL